MVCACTGVPVGVLQLLSCVWRGQLPAGMVEPPADVFAVDLQGTFKPMVSCVR